MLVNLNGKISYHAYMSNLGSI
uniref:Uncharacterized protein n=1 Tax=Arundo donax TaxID=35708 RepID=A0A0A9AUG1_ARUDO